MMKRYILTILALLVFPLSAFALTVSGAVITTKVVDRVPVDKVEVYPAQLGKLYCFSRVEGATADTSIEHVWLYQGDEMARVRLPVKSANWRTYSSKKMFPAWKGEWEVRILDDAGNELARVPFKVE
ncbi:DUF2914 domain-containing protein [Geopsychrobacter electrodiphilus]|uniref:DUF2914 domain-containing protein n=1 Tax=Geopsychrobacter electrodiphilus TaxID=225196 RepID=UPI000381DEC9|nr:DUF2914 domain-containing protein [Geopsychrobacter electrodiphilus]